MNERIHYRTKRRMFQETSNTGIVERESKSRERKFTGAINPQRQEYEGDKVGIFVYCQHSVIYGCRFVRNKNQERI